MVSTIFTSDYQCLAPKIHLGQALVGSITWTCAQRHQNSVHERQSAIYEEISSLTSVSELCVF